MDEIEEIALGREAARAFGAAAGLARHVEQQHENHPDNPVAQIVAATEHLKLAERIRAQRAHLEKLVATSSGVGSQESASAARDGAELGEAVFEIFRPPTPRPAADGTR